MSSQGENRSILLIDDSASVREVLRVALESEGYHVIEAADGREGVRLYQEHRPALVLVDIVMPEKDGIETVKEILAIDPAAVIFTMSGQDADYQEVARTIGARMGFEKPMNLNSLVSAVQEYFPGLPAFPVQKIYREGFRITAGSDGLLIEAIEYHTRPLTLDKQALAALGLMPRTPGGSKQ